MTEAPERIYMDPDIMFPECEKQYGCDVEYIRKDVSDALIAAAYVDAANLHQSLWRETSAYKTDQILKRTSTDTRQALDALLKAERERALREAAKIAERHDANDRGEGSAVADCIRAEILALISEDATDG